MGAAEQTALRLIMLAETLRRRLVAAGASYRTFFSWLLITMRRWVGVAGARVCRRSRVAGSQPGCRGASEVHACGHIGSYS